MRPICYLQMRPAKPNVADCLSLVYCQMVLPVTDEMLQLV